MAVIKSGATSDQWTIDATSKAGRVTLYDATGRAIANHTKQTFGVSATFTPVATPTELVYITGSATKTVYVLSMKISTTNTAAGSQHFRLFLRTTANSGGTFVGSTVVPFDSANDSATATVGHYTANPTTGTGTRINSRVVASTVLVPGNFAGVRENADVEMVPTQEVTQLAQLVTLRGVAQGLAINFNGIALESGQVHTYSIVWIEE